MPLHLVKMAVGIEDVDQLAVVQKKRMASARAGRVCIHTRNTPSRRDELLDGGSIYWIIKGYIRARQRLCGLDRKADEEGRRYCEIWLDSKLVRTQLYPRKPQQGWRYLEEGGTPADLDSGGLDDSLPPEMAAELRGLGLL